MRLPTVLNMDGPVIVFGGGKVGLRKVEYLSRFTRDIVVVGEDNLPMPEYVTTKVSKVKAEDIESLVPENTVLVIAALSDVDLNRDIAERCRQRDILVNVVDDPDHSTVLFPALSKEGDINIAISTSGKCPFLARKVREEVDLWVREKARWLEVLAPVRELMDGVQEKNRILSLIYGDPDISGMIEKGDLEGAKKKAMEVYDVHRQP